MKTPIRTLATSGFVCGALTLFASSPVHSRTFAEIYAECGLGAMLFNSATSDSGPNARAFAIISNVTSDLGTTAVLSDASSEENCAGSPSTTASLMMQVWPGLERDIARGEGEYLDALYGSAACVADVRPALTVALRAELADGVAGDDLSRVERAGALYDAMAERVATDHPGLCAI